jgi:hydrogenase-4 component F
MSIYLYLFTAAALSIVTYFVRQVRLSHAIVFLFVVVQIVFGLSISMNGCCDELFSVDRLGLIFFWILILVTAVSAVHYISYASWRETEVKSIALHNAGTIFFTGAISGVLLTSHFGVLWAFVEATTIGASVLIYHDRNQDSLEATWKYLFVCSIGVALAFMGVLFLGMASQKAGHVDFTFQSIKSVAAKFNPTWLKACFLLIVTGFSSKMSLVPLFNVGIDAKDASPSQVGASLSSVLMNAGFVAIYRFYEAFSQTEILNWMNNVLLITGLASLFFAAAYILKVRNIKRLFAYSSMEHAALVTIAFATGGIGYFAAVLHLILHSLVKSSMFFQVSQMHRIFESKWDDRIGSYLRINPLGGIVFLLGFLSIIAMPPSGMLITELRMFQSLIVHHEWWISAIVLVLVLVIIYGLAQKMLGILFLKRDLPIIHIRGASFLESMIQLVMILIVFYIGLFSPELIVNNINMAIQTLPH